MALINIGSKKPPHNKNEGGIDPYNTPYNEGGIDPYNTPYDEFDKEQGGGTSTESTANDNKNTTSQKPVLSEEKKYKVKERSVLIGTTLYVEGQYLPKEIGKKDVKRLIKKGVVGAE